MFVLAALDQLLPLQRQDFAEIFAVMRGKPVIVRLLDPPLHEVNDDDDDDDDDHDDA